MRYLDSHSLDANGVWTLWMAVRCGKLEMAKLLIEQGAHIDDAILYTAKQYGHTEIVDYLKSLEESENGKSSFHQLNTIINKEKRNDYHRNSSANQSRLYIGERYIGGDCPYSVHKGRNEGA